MSAPTPRMRMFAGPNGSGKSTLKSVLPAQLLGVYLNPDEIEQEIRRQRNLNFSTYGVNATGDDALKFFRGSLFLKSAGLTVEADKLIFAHGCLDFRHVAINSYFASVASDFLRHKLLEQKTSFTLETVMSHNSKIQFLDVKIRDIESMALINVLPIRVIREFRGFFFPPLRPGG